MDRLSFDVFEPEKKTFRLTPNLIILLLWSFTIFLLWAFKNLLPPNSTGRVVWLVFVVLVTLYYLVTSYFKYGALNGQINGKIIFQSDSVIIRNQTFNLKDISSLDFGFVDFYGETSTFRRDFNPKISQGVNNYISFIDDKNQSQKFYFRMMTKHSSLTLYPFINQAVKCKAMSYYRAIDLIGAENVTKS